jgi:hypothetical protein
VNNKFKRSKRGNGSDKSVAGLSESSLGKPGSLAMGLLTGLVGEGRFWSYIYKEAEEEPQKRLLNKTRRRCESGRVVRN